jgi:hypothetical protein
MLIGVVGRTEGCQGQPGESGREVTISQPIPQQLTPLDVIVTVKVSATNAGGRELKPPENESD